MDIVSPKKMSHHGSDNGEEQAETQAGDVDDHKLYLNSRVTIKSFSNSRRKPNANG
jgi:hypothetical protein